METSISVIIAFVVLFSACGKTTTVIRDKGTVAAEQSPLPNPPATKPAGEIPPIIAPSDVTIQNDEVEDAALSDALKLNSADALNTVYLSGANFVNFGDDVKSAMNGVNLGLNLLSSRSFIENVRPVNASKSLWAVDLRDYFGNKGLVNWKLIEDQAVIKIVSKTIRFKNLQFITQKRLPIMHAQIFMETAFKAKTYYQLKDIPQLENDFWVRQGIDRQRQFDDRDQDIFLAGFSDSQIAPDHNREVRRMEGTNGPCWNTYDVDANTVVLQSNFFLFPFPPEARSRQTLIHNAGEILCRQANGLWVGALYAGNGQRADFAPTTVVVNTRTSALGLDPSITLRDCAGCHTSFILAVKDDIARQVRDNPFSASDKLLAQIFFRPQAELDQIIANDNRDHAEVLARMGIRQGEADPLNVALIDKMRDGYTAKELAAFLYLSESDFLEKLSGSQTASQEVGQLLQGGSIGFIQLQASIQRIIDDLLLFQDQR